jgi:hypothetical protein
MNVFIRCPKIIKISLFVDRFSLVVEADNNDNYDNVLPRKPSRQD